MKFTEEELEAMQNRVKERATPMLERALKMGLKPRPEGSRTSGIMSMMGSLTGAQPSSIVGSVVNMKAKGKTEKPQNEKLNKTEARYARHLEGLKLAGEILWYRNHAFGLYFDDGTRYTPDFVVMDVRGGITLIDTKAFRKNQNKVHITEASMLKMKRTACEYWMFTMKAVYEKDGAWQEIVF